MKAKSIFFLLLVLCLSLFLSLFSTTAFGTRPSSPASGSMPLITLNPGMDNLALAGTDVFRLFNAGPKEEMKTKTYTGFLTVGAQLMCTRSEGPVYYLQFYNDEQNGIKILKHGSNAPFVHDLTLDSYLLTKVTIVGLETPTGVEYLKIMPFDCRLGPKDVVETVFSGYLFAKLDNIGDKSEGPSYYLQGFDYSEFYVAKDCQLWENDPKLHPLLNTKVTITGEEEDGRIVYKTIEPYKPQGEEKEK